MHYGIGFVIGLLIGVLLIFWLHNKYVREVELLLGTILRVIRDLVDVVQRLAQSLSVRERKELGDHIFNAQSVIRRVAQLLDKKKDHEGEDDLPRA